MARIERDASDVSEALSAQQWSADAYARNGRFVAELGADVAALLAPQRGERILDLGCGDGALTRRLAESGAAIVGADASPELAGAARSLGLDIRAIDGHALPFVDEFDAVFSNAALHWMTRPAEVIAGVHRALRPGGRFVAEMGGHGNVAAIRTALHAVLRARGHDARARDPWFFPTAEGYAELLAVGGFTVDSIALFARPTALPTGMDGWLQTFAGPLFAGLPEAERAAIIAAVVALLEPILCDERGGWTADYVRLRFAARRE